jgi:hypothetical protein
MLAWQHPAMEPVNREIKNEFGKLTVFNEMTSDNQHEVCLFALYQLTIK